ncbi:GNAT family N-acetyltransferase [Flammeovirgaceae bacterium SG7u.111]|nr:GNAT family N-acetyltransferase [Flammeovirgaceae bacterium SG7u.132]WPO34492.1 GNAT family N-acetyltransferase [Flammeovirgaceae bacterium SG7u.111]
MIKISDAREVSQEEIVALYEANKWSSAKKPDELYKALLNSDYLVTARDAGKLVGIGNALSNGYLVVYYPHLLVLPEYHGKGVGKMIMKKFAQKYGHLHQQILVADGGAIQFYEKCGFEKAGETQSMWIYKGGDH